MIVFFECNTEQNEKIYNQWYFSNSYSVEKEDGKVTLVEVIWFQIEEVAEYLIELQPI